MPYCFAETICLTLLPLLTVPFEDVSVMCDRRDSSYVPHSLVRKDLPFSYVVRSYVSFFILVEVMPLSSRYKSYCHVNKHTLSLFASVLYLDVSLLLLLESFTGL